MSGIRKYRRHKVDINNQKKTTVKMSLWDVLMIVGAVMLFMGAIVGILCYTTYTAGRAEHIWDGEDGRSYHPEEAPGNPSRKLQAYIGLVTASIGCLLLLVSVPAYLIGKRHCRSDNDVAYNE